MPRTTARRTSAVVAGLIAVAGLSGCVTDDGSSFDGHVKSVSYLTAGDCLPEAISESQTAVIVVDCDEPHTLEIYYTVMLPELPAAPSDSAIAEVVDGRCEGALHDVPGAASKDTQASGIFIWGPDAQQWRVGNRNLVCALVSASGEPTTGSLLG